MSQEYNKLRDSFYRRDKTRHPESLSPGYRSSILRSPRSELVSFANTISETTGPAFSEENLSKLDDDLTKNFSAVEQIAIGEKIIVHGQVKDENARPVPNVLIELWQANAAGRYRHNSDGYNVPLDPNFGGFGRCVTDEMGFYSFRSIRPGAYPWPNGGNNWRPSHIHFSIFGPSFAQRLITQMYFEGDPLINLCPIAQSLKDKAALSSLIASLDMKNTIHMDARAYEFQIVLRGERLTFFENDVDNF